MTTLVEAIRARRAEILKKISELEQIRRGSVIEQFVKTIKADGSTGSRGPYALYSYKERGKTISRRVTDSEQIPIYRSQIQAFRQFQELVSELTVIGEQFSNLAISETGEKKRPKLP